MWKSRPQGDAKSGGGQTRAGVGGDPRVALRIPVLMPSHCWSLLALRRSPQLRIPCLSLHQAAQQSKCSWSWSVVGMLVGWDGEDTKMLHKQHLHPLLVSGWRAVLWDLLSVPVIFFQTLSHQHLQQHVQCAAGPGPPPG